MINTITKNYYNGEFSSYTITYQNSGGALNVIGYSDAAARIYTSFGAYKIIE